MYGHIGNVLAISSRFFIYLFIIRTVHSVISYSQNNQCITITNKEYLVVPTYVSATNMPSSGGRLKNHSYSRHPTMHTLSITIKAHMPLTTLKWNWCTHSQNHTIKVNSIVCPSQSLCLFSSNIVNVPTCRQKCQLRI